VSRRCRVALLPLLALAACAGGERAAERPAPGPEGAAPGPEEAAPAAEEAATPAPEEAATPAPVVERTTPAEARDPAAPADPERVAELRRRIAAEQGQPPPRPAAGDAPPGRAPPAPGPAPPAGAAPGWREGLAAELEAAGPADGPEDGGLAGLLAAEERLEESYARLKELRRRLVASRREARREVGSTYRELDEALVLEIERLRRKSVGVVVGSDRAYVESHADEIEALERRRDELRADYEADLADVAAEHGPAEGELDALQDDVLERLRDVRRRIAAHR